MKHTFKSAAKLLLGLSLGLNLLTQACVTQKEGPYEAVTVQKELTQNASELKSVTSFAFGSCNKQYLPQPLWKHIVAESPDLFLWTGDVVYADTEDMGKLSQIYASQLRQAEYSRFLQSKIPVIGVWDDHDYGQNNGDRSFKPRKESQALFLDFIGEAPNSPRREQDGIYTVHSFGSGKGSTRFLLLDTRSHRSHPKGGEDADLLGEAQWKWLETELQKKVEGVTFVVSSIQILPKEQKFEKWTNFPKSHARLLSLIEQSPSSNIVLISGDRHFAELTKQKIGQKEIFEITSSGMTHAFRNPDEVRNRNSMRVGPILDRLNYGLITLDEKASSLRIQVKDINRTAIIDQTIPIL